jgi:hypothetical protein
VALLARSDRGNVRKKTTLLGVERSIAVYLEPMCRPARSRQNRKMELFHNKVRFTW